MREKFLAALAVVTIGATALLTGCGPAETNTSAPPETETSTEQPAKNKGDKDPAPTQPETVNDPNCGGTWYTSEQALTDGQQVSEPAVVGVSAERTGPAGKDKKECYDAVLVTLSGKTKPKVYAQYDGVDPNVLNVTITTPAESGFTTPGTVLLSPSYTQQHKLQSIEQVQVGEGATQLTFLAITTSASQPFLISQPSPTLVMVRIKDR